MEPGPIDPSLLALQHRHRSGPIWDGQVVEELHCRRRQAVLHRTFPLDPRIIPYLQRAGFYGVARVGFIQLDWHLVTALIERWRQETHTFHLVVGEATITLQDVEVLLGLPVDGLPVSGSTDLDYDALCLELLGFAPEGTDRRGGRLKLATIANRVPPLADDATEVQLERYARAYIMQLIGGCLFSDQSNNLVHLGFLPFLADFDVAGTYAWGSATLAWLYRQLCRAVDFKKQGVSGCLILLQMWAWDRFPHVAPIRSDSAHDDPVGLLAPHLPPPPLGYRWRNALVTTQVPMHVLVKYRELLDMQSNDQIIWTPYSEDLINGLPDYCRRGRDIWRTVSPLICFAIVELHQPDRVMRQFGMRQTIPEPCNTSLELHDYDMRGQADTNWTTVHSHYIEQWEQRTENLAEGELIQGEASCHLDYFDPYMVWYRSVSRRFMTVNGATINYLATQLAEVQLCTQRNDLTALRDIDMISRTALQTVHMDHMVRVQTTEGPSSTYRHSPMTPPPAFETFADVPATMEFDSTQNSFQEDPTFDDVNLEHHWIGRGRRRPRRGGVRGRGHAPMVEAITEAHDEALDDATEVVPEPVQPTLRQYTRDHLRRNKRRHWPTCGTE